MPASTLQQGDLSLEQTLDGGDITVVNGVALMTPGLEVSLYLALFGGNVDDDGVGEDNRNQYWGNYVEDNDADKLRSRTQYLLQDIPATSANLRKIERAADFDLRYLITEKIASAYTVTASIPAINRVQIAITVTADGREEDFKFSTNWKASIS